MILPLEKQACSLESAKRLKELGFPQDSLFYWTRRTDKKNIKMERFGVYQGRDLRNIDPEYSAYTVAELGTILGYCQWPTQGEVIKHFEGNEAEARAKLLIDLKTRSLI